MRIIIIGGVAAGMSAASKAKRTDSNSQIVVYEKSDVVSWGACGLPYYVGDFYEDPNTMIARPLNKFIESGIDVKTKHEVLKVYPVSKTVTVKDLSTGNIFDDKYDVLMVATGASAIIPPIENKNLKIAVAKDEAFSFYYTENLELLKEAGEIVYFSPLHDKKLPDNIDFLYLGGGYPEVFIKELSNNTSMLKSIKSELNNGLKCYAECGGLMYLTESISTLDGKEFNTVGFFKGKSIMTTRLQNFGYCAINIDEKSPLLKDLSINAHEFHKSKVELDENYIYNLTKNSYDGSIKNWNCGYVKDNTLGAYGHIHFFGNINFLKELLK